MRPHRNKRLILLSVFLALFCVGVVELIACSYYDPELFRSITSPVVNAVKATADGAKSAVAATGQAIEDLCDRIEASIEEAREKRAAEKLQAELEAAAKQEAELPPEPDAVENQATTPPLLNISSTICDPSVTELKTVEDQQFLTGGPIRIVYYHQSDERWGNLKFGSDKISTHGCGPTAMAMVVSSMTDQTILPQDMAKWAADNGYWARHSGSYHSIVIGTAEAFGLHAQSYPLRSTDALREELMAGNLLVALMGPGHFTRSGHFIVLRGVTLSGDILIADPGSPERSLASWDAQLLLDELSKSTAHGSPLWLISMQERPDLE